MSISTRKLEIVKEAHTKLSCNWERRMQALLLKQPQSLLSTTRLDVVRNRAIDGWEKLTSTTINDWQYGIHKGIDDK